MFNQGLHSRVSGWCLALLLMAVEAWGGNGGEIVLPAGGVKNRSGLRLQINSEWVTGSGYRPVKIRIFPQPPGPAPADRTVQVLLRPLGWYQGSYAGAVTATVELRQGDLFGEATVLIPQTNTWSRMAVETREDGRRHWELGSETGFTINYYGVCPEQTPSIVVVHWGANRPDASTSPARIGALYFEYAPTFVGPQGAGILPLVQATPNPRWYSTVQPRTPAFQAATDIVARADQFWVKTRLDVLPDVRKLVGLFPENFQNSNGNVAGLMSSTGPVTDVLTKSLVDSLPNMHLLAADALPSNWLAYTNIDVLIIAREDLAALTVEQRTAVRAWLHLGTVLCVYDAGAGFDHLAQFEELLDIEPIDAAAPRRGWSIPLKGDFKSRVEALPSGGQSAIQYQYVNGVMVPLNSPTTTEVISAPENPSFVSRSVGQGRLVALAAANPFPGQPAEWSWMFNSIPARNWLNYQRVGVSQYQDNDQFWNFLIEGVGRAPVKSFLGMISLFVVLIGPVNYWFLTRRRKLYLLLVTVPAGAALVSVGLFLFAVLADGLGTRLRLRSYTELDSKRGEYRTWSRQTYYAGVSPSGGLTFPAESEVLRVEHRPTKYGGGEDQSRHMVWGEDQHFVSGYFPPRTMSQFVVIQRADTPARLLVRESSEGPPTVRNELGVEIERAALRDARGDLYEILALPNGQEQTATKLDLDTQGKAWRAGYRAALPQYPPNFDPSQIDDVSGFFFGTYRPFANSVVTPSLNVSVMELSLANLHDGQFSGLGKKQFLAVVPRSPFVARGVNSIAEEKGTHTVVGRWHAW